MLVPEIGLHLKPYMLALIWNIFQVNCSSLKNFIAILVISTQDFWKFKDLKKSRFWVGVTKIAIQFYKYYQLTYKMSQIEAYTCICEFILFCGANRYFTMIFSPWN